MMILNLFCAFKVCYDYCVYVAQGSIDRALCIVNGGNEDDMALKDKM